MKKLFFNMIMICVLLSMPFLVSIAADYDYTVTFYTFTDDNIVPTYTDVENEAYIVDEPTSPSRTSCSFEGWYEDYDFTEAYDFSSRIIMDITLYAKWTCSGVPYKVEVHDDDGSILFEAEHTPGDNIAYISPELPTKVGHTFTGWYNLTNVMPSKDLYIEAQYEPIIYEVIFLDYDGSTIYVEQHPYGGDLKDVIVPPNPEREGYIFNRWNGQLPDTMPDHSITINAGYVPVMYNITYLDHDNTILYVDPVGFETDLTTYEFPITPIREGYNFTGWSSDLPLTMPGNNIALQATYEIQELTITFYGYNGAIISFETYNYGDDLTGLTYPQPPEVSGLTFSRWDKDIPDTITSDVSVVALYGENYYIVTYNVDGIEYSFEIVQYGQVLQHIPTPIKNGYTFEYWTQDGSEINLDSYVQGSEDVTFEAVFSGSGPDEAVLPIRDKIITIEVGSDFTPDVCLTNDTYITCEIAGSVDTNNLGVYYIIYKFKTEEDVEERATHTIKVVDTTAPVIDPTDPTDDPSVPADVDYTVMHGDEFNLVDLIIISENIDSINDVTVVVNDKIEMDSPGYYRMSISLTDSNLNTSDIEITIFVKPDLIHYLYLFIIFIIELILIFLVRRINWVWLHNLRRTYTYWDFGIFSVLLIASIVFNVILWTTKSVSNIIDSTEFILVPSFNIYKLIAYLLILILGLFISYLYLIYKPELDVDDYDSHDDGSSYSKNKKQSKQAKDEKKWSYQEYLENIDEEDYIDDEDDYIDGSEDDYIDNTESGEYKEELDDTDDVEEYQEDPDDIDEYVEDPNDIDEYVEDPDDIDDIDEYEGDSEDIDNVDGSEDDSHNHEKTKDIDLDSDIDEEDYIDEEELEYYEEEYIDEDDYIDDEELNLHEEFEEVDELEAEIDEIIRNRTLNISNQTGEIIQENVTIVNYKKRKQYVKGETVDNGYYLEIYMKQYTVNHVVYIIDNTVPTPIFNESTYVQINEHERKLFTLSSTDLTGATIYTPGSFTTEGYYVEVDTEMRNTERYRYTKKRLPPTSKKGHRWVKVKPRKIRSRNRR